MVDEFEFLGEHAVLVTDTFGKKMIWPRDAWDCLTEYKRITGLITTKDADVRDARTAYREHYERSLRHPMLIQKVHPKAGNDET